MAVSGCNQFAASNTVKGCISSKALFQIIILAQYDILAKRFHMSDIDFVTVVAFGMLILLGVVLLFRYMSGSLSRRWKAHRADTVDQWAADGVEFELGPVAAQFGGLESMGVAKAVRGVGYAVLTPKDLRVTSATPTTVWWTLNFRQIKGITLKRSFLGKRVKQTPFIVVRFVKDGQADKLGFQVKDFEAWAQKIADKAGVSVDEQAAD